MPETDTWAFCPSCDRWYYCGGDVSPPSLCPVCRAQPVDVEDRNQQTVG